MSSADRPVIVRAPSLFRLKPIARALAGLAGVVPVMAWAQLPVGAEVVAGSATVTTPDANHMVVQQGSAKAILNWQQFSIGEQGYVQFIQPGASAIALNRVVGADPSAILGKLSANGQVFLVNPNGVFFGAGAQVDVGGIVATTLDIANEDFLDGQFRFDKAPGHEGATVVNAGVINTAKGGYVVLAGDYVANQGVIQTQAGTALLASGNALTLQLSGSSLVDFAVDEAAVVELAGVENTGQILANGGRVIMTAKVANELAATVVNNEGLVQAQSTVEKDGVIYLLGEGGNVANAGTLDASAQAGADGGHVEMRASGDLLHEAGSRIAVSGADSGVSDAGDVYTWADGTNRFKAGAKIEGKGGAAGGNGAAIELSGRGVQIAGDVDLRAAKGKGGSILLDPLNITITDQDSTAAGGSTVGELWIENQLNLGTDITLLADGGEGASITLADLTDNVLDGTNVDGTGGSLTLRAVGDNARIEFASGNDAIKVDHDLILSAENGSGGYTGTTIAVGHLSAGQGIPNGGGLNLDAPVPWQSSLTLEGGTVSVGGNLILGRASIATNTDSAYTLSAHAHSGDLQVYGDVQVAVTNTSAAAVATDVTLRADAGNVDVSGDVISNAIGKGYYHYTWQTRENEGSRNDATSYYGEQPWELTGQGDHAIGANLDIQAGGYVTVDGNVDVRAIDQSSNFAGNGGYFQTANATRHVFWRATAADAAATITAGGNVAIGGGTSVVADGYANAAYGETEFWDQMVNEVQLVAQSQQIYQTYGDDDENPDTPDRWYNPQSEQVTTTGKGGNTGKYTWGQSGYNANSGGPYTSPSTTYWETGSSGTNTGPMAYSGQAGLTATLAIEAGGDVTLNGIDNRAINRSNNGGTNYTDANWASQDTAGAGLSVSASQEINYSDSFTTAFTVAPATAATTISAGDNRSVQLNGEGVSYHVEANHTAVPAGTDTTAHASMTVTAGSEGGASGDGLITLAGPITVKGSSINEVHLTVTNHDGAISHAVDAGTLAIDNQYNSGVARAAFTSDAGAIGLGTVTVDAGRTGYFSAGAATAAVTLDNVAVDAGTEAYIDADAGQNLTLTGTASADASNRAQIDLTSTGAQVKAEDAVTATGGVAAVTMNGKTGVSTSGVTASGATSASITLGSSAADITTNGALAATASAASGAAAIGIDGATGVTLNGAVTAQATNFGTLSYPPYTINSGGTATVDIQGGTGGVAVKGNVTANSHRHSIVDIATGAALTLDAGTTVSASTASSASASSLVYESSIDLSGGTGLTVNGNVTASASKGIATVDLQTTGGSTAAIAQDAASTIAASGNSGSINIHAGAESPTASDAAAFALDGTLQATGSAGTAQLTVAGAGGTINDFGALSSASQAKVDIATLDADGLLTLTGTGTVTGYTSAMGAQLGVTGAGSLDSSGAVINVKNNHDGDSAIAKATLIASGGTSTLGTIDVSTAGKGTAELTATATGDLSTAGNLSAKSYQFTGDELQSSGTATVTLTSSTGDVSLANDVTARGNANATVSVTATNGTLTQTAGTVQAYIDRGVEAEVAFASGDVMTVEGTVSAIASDGIATANLTSGATPTDDADALAVNGNIGANNLAGEASVLISTTGGDTASIALAQSSSIGAAGGTASKVTILAGTDDADGMNAGNAADFKLDGSLSAGLDDPDPQYRRAGTAQITVAGKSGSVSQFTSFSADTANVSITAYNGDLKVIGNGGSSVAVSAADNASANLNATGTLTLGDATHGIDVVTTGTGTAASLTAAGTNGLIVSGALSATATDGTADIELASDGILTVNSSAIVEALGGTSAEITLTSNAAAAEGDELVLDGDLTATSGSWAKVTATTTGANASIAQGADSLVTVGGADTASATFTSAGELTIGGDIIAAATDDGTASGEHTGSAYITLNTTGGATAGITQGSGSLVSAVGQNTRLVVEAGGSDLAENTAQAAAFDLNGSLQAIDATGGSTLVISGASGSVHDFEVAAANAPASATITAYTGDLILDGTGSVAGNYDSATGAVLAVTAAGDLDSHAATLSVANGNLGADAGAGASLTAAGDNALGALAVTTAGSGAATLTATAVGDLAANGALSADATTGAASITLNSSAGNAAIAAAGSASASSDGNATITLDGATGVDIAGDLTATSMSGSNISVSTTGTNASIAQGADSLVTVGGADTASATFTSAGQLTIDGDIIAAATDDGTASGEHTGSAYITLETTGGATAGITQGSASLVSAVGQNTWLVVEAGGSDLAENTAQAAAFDLNGSLQAIDATGGSTLVISGASGSVHDFEVAAANAPASATITAYTGDLTLDGTGSVAGNYDSATGAVLAVTAAGDLDSHAATLSVANGNLGADAGAGASLTAAGDNALGALAVTTTGGGAATLTATAGGDLAANGALSADATTGAASITLNSSAGNAAIAAAGSASASSDGNAAITLDGATGVNIAGDLTATGGDWADISVTATGDNASITQGADSTVTLGGAGGAAADFTSKGSLVIDGDIVAAATADGTASGAHTGAAYITLNTTGGATAGITQGSGSLVSAVGSAARVDIAAGTSDPADHPTQAAAFDLNGTLQAIDAFDGSTLTISGASGSVHDFEVAAANAPASATITAYTGDLTLDGNGSVTGDGSSDARLTVTAAGALDTRGAVLTVANLGSASAELEAGQGGRLGAIGVDSTGGAALADLGALDGALELGAVTVTGATGATLSAATQHGDLAQRAGSALAASGGSGTGLIELTANGGNLALRQATASGAAATLAATATGTLAGTAGTTQQASAGMGAATVQLASGGAMTIDGNVRATSSAGAATLALTSGGSAGIGQGGNSTIAASGSSAAVTLQAGDHQGGALALNGKLQATATTGAATLAVDGGAGTVHDFSALSSAGRAQAEINSHGAGQLVLNGTGSVKGKHDRATGAELTVDAAGGLDTHGATLTVANSHSGAAAGAVASLASTGQLISGPVSVDATGGKDAALSLHGGAVRIEGDLFATAHNTGAGLGGAAITVTSGDAAGAAANIHQSADSTIRASSGGVEAGDARVLIAAGHCCDAEVELLGTSTAQVDSGAGNASVAVRGSDVAVQDITAHADGRGDSLIELAAPYTLTVNGLLDSQAASAAAQAGIVLVTDKLDYRNSKAKLSQGNGYVQLAPFNTTYMIGVESEPDFDATPAIHYNMALLQKFDGFGAELRFGGAFDRTPWLDASGNSCVPGMAQWQDLGQHTGEIHVAGAGIGQLRLASASMVFDTTGNTYYHDNQMTPWSVPTGRTAIYVPRPTASLDRYLDRTDNSIQTSLFGVENAAAPTLQPPMVAMAPEGTVPVAGDMFMAGDGINLSRIDITGAMPEAGAGGGAAIGGAAGGTAGDIGGAAGNRGAGDLGGAAGSGGAGDGNGAVGNGAAGNGAAGNGGAGAMGGAADSGAGSHGAGDGAKGAAARGEGGSSADSAEPDSSPRDGAHTNDEDDDERSEV